MSSTDSKTIANVNERHSFIILVVYIYKLMNYDEVYLQVMML